MTRFVIGLDFGGTHLRAALVDESGQIVERLKRKTQADHGPETVFDNLAAAVRALADQAPSDRLLGVGVAAPGPVDPSIGVIYSPPNLPGWGDVPLTEILEARSGLPIVLGNDANLAAVGEHVFGAGVGRTDMIYLTISTGIGGGVITQNRLLLGNRGLAGELGHMQIIPDGPTCGCGQRGHLEALATGPAIALRMAGLLRSGLSSHLQAAGETVTPEQIVAAAQKGDALSIQVLEEAGSFIGMAVANLVHIFAPQRFVIGGGVANGAGDLLLEPVRRTAHERLMRGYHDTYDIVPPALGDDSGLLGAAAYAFQQFRNTFSTTS